MRTLYSIVAVVLLSVNSLGQAPFNFTLAIEPVIITGLPGLHSYAVAQHDGKWLVIGGRLDGMHARQPFSSFPASQNNSEIYVIDVDSRQFRTASLNTLPTGIFEQLQSTNMNFHQDGDTLYIIGGYGFSATADDHITFPNLTSVQVSDVIDAVLSETSFVPYFKQISDTLFAVTGGQLGKIKDKYYLVGGHRFDGLYNPVGNPTFSQSYTNQIRKFTIQNSGTGLGFADLSSITDPIHLRRRDYNLMPQIFPDGEEGYTISSGSFKPNADLPFLYPVDITESGYRAVTEFNQYLSNYHSAKASLFDSTANQMHMLFFGGMSQYYYEDGNLIQDDQVPFVKTISRISRSSDGTLQEYKLPIEMPGLKGASAEFILNHHQPHYESEIIKLNQINEDSILIGYIYGGISSPTLNPFADNVTSKSSADPTIYRVKLIRALPDDVEVIPGIKPFDFEAFPNPFSNKLNIRPANKDFDSLDLRIFNSLGERVFSDSYNGSESITIRTGHFPVGIYFLQTMTDGDIQTIKLIKAN